MSVCLCLGNYGAAWFGVGKPKQQICDIWRNVLTEQEEKTYAQLERCPDYTQGDRNSQYDLNVFLDNDRLLSAYFNLMLNNIADHNGFQTGVYGIVSRINHSCAPNCDIVINGSEGSPVDVYTVKDVKKDEELTYSYIAFFLESQDIRRGRILNDRCFICVCELCTAPPAQRARLEADREGIRRLSNDINFVMYRIEAKRHLAMHPFISDGPNHPSGRVKGKRAKGPLPSTVVNENGEISLDATLTELDNLMAGIGLHGREMGDLYATIGEVALELANTRSLARSGRAMEYAQKWWAKHIDELRLIGRMEIPGVREQREAITQALVDMRRNLR